MNKLWVLISFYLVFIVAQGSAIAKTYNVTNFGAKVNDGLDDSSAIETALAKSVSGDAVYFPAGHYHITRPINLKSGIKIYGTTSATSVINWIGTDVQWMVTVLGLATNPMRDVKIVNLVLDGNNLPMAGGIGSWHSTNLLIQKNIIRNFAAGGSVATHGIHFISAVTNSTINANIIDNIAPDNEWGAAVRWSWGSTNNKITNNKASRAGRGGYLCNDQSSGSVITNNTFTGARHEALGIELWVGCGNALVENNRIDHWLSVGGANNSAIRNNIIASPTEGDFKFIGLEIALENNYIIATGNRIGYGQMIGLSVSGGGERKYVYLANNVFDGASTWAAQFDGTDQVLNRHWYLYRNTFKNTLPVGNPYAWSVAAYWNDVGHGLRFFGGNYGLNFKENIIQLNPGTSVQSLYGTNSRISFLNNTFDRNGWLYGPVWGEVSYINEMSWLGNKELSTPGSGIPSEKLYANEEQDNLVLQGSSILCTGEMKAGTELSCSANLDPALNPSDVEEVLWDFGDGLPQSGLTTVKVYPRAGKKTVTAILFLKSGSSARKTQALTLY